MLFFAKCEISEIIVPCLRVLVKGDEKNPPFFFSKNLGKQPRVYAENLEKTPVYHANDAKNGHKIMLKKRKKNQAYRVKIDYAKKNHNTKWSLYKSDNLCQIQFLGGKRYDYRSTKGLSGEIRRQVG